MSVVTLRGFQPSPREDAPWTKARIEEAADAGGVPGTWTALETQTLDPVEPDPSQPLVRELTTDQATLTSGWYRVVFIDADGNEETAGPVRYDARSAGAIPTVRDVAALLQQRVKGSGGHTADLFTTNPTIDQVQALIDTEASLVLIDVGNLSDETLICSTADDIRRAVRGLIAKRVAALVEASYWPQDMVAGDTAEAFWRRIVEVDTPKVVAAARECRLGDVQPGGDDGGGGIAMRPAYSFNAGPRVGNRSF